MLHIYLKYINGQTVRFHRKNKANIVDLFITLYAFHVNTQRYTVCGMKEGIITLNTYRIPSSKDDDN